MNTVVAYMGMVDTLLVTLLPTVLVAATVFFLYARKLTSTNRANRREEMHLLAMKINFNFSASDEIGIGERIESEKTFFYGSDGTVENVIYGSKNGIDVALFDYIFSNLQKQNLSVCILTLPTKIGTFKMLPLDDLDIEEGKAIELGEKLLGDKYRLECEDKAFAQEAFNEDLVEFLSRRRRTTVLGNGNSIVFHRDKLLTVRTCFSLLDFAFGLYTKMQLGGVPAPEIPKSPGNGETLDLKADLYAE
jgi:hypothetical protein